MTAVYFAPALGLLLILAAVSWSERPMRRYRARHAANRTYDTHACLADAFVAEPVHVPPSIVWRDPEPTETPIFDELRYTHANAVVDAMARVDAAEGAKFKARLQALEDLSRIESWWSLPAAGGEQ